MELKETIASAKDEHKCTGIHSMELKVLGTLRAMGVRVVESIQWN